MYVESSFDKQFAEVDWALIFASAAVASFGQPQPYAACWPPWPLVNVGSKLQSRNDTAGRTSETVDVEREVRSSVAVWTEWS